MSEINNENLIEENKRLKLDVETYLKGYENILAEKIRLLETDTVLYNKISQDVKFVVDTYLSQISFSKNINKFLAVI